ncbi:MAG: TetR/AcrR family transcriptional regulator [Acidobacteria bacterium]|nr:MAG: TetR/AcrR family transcriptional regulator [Acidobacteriota bacterium]
MTGRPTVRDAQPDTATRILDVAERLVQTSGFNGFSYADISAELGITKASLHHHFATKAELGRALIERYSEAFSAALKVVDQRGGDAAAKLERYVKLYEEVLREERLCLCGMLAAEYSTLPEPLQKEIRRFFDANETWLAGVIDQGRRAKIFHLRGSAREVARMLLSALEGAMLVARPYSDVARFASAARQVLTGLAAK